MPGTVLDAWTARKIGLPAGAFPRREDIERHQLAMLRRTLQTAQEYSPFYAKRLSGLDVERDIGCL